MTRLALSLVLLASLVATSLIGFADTKAGQSLGAEDSVIAAMTPVRNLRG